jgi:hypothetical protein
MKKQFFIGLAGILTIGFAGQLFAQNAAGVQLVKSKSNISNNMVGNAPEETCVVKVTTTGNACEIVFTSQVQNPRDASSGMATGKRMHKPFVITKEFDKASPMLARESPTKQSLGKVSVSDINVMLSVGGRSQKLSGVNGEFTLPKCPNGDCNMVVSWSWGESNSGTTKRCEVPVQLTIEDVACIAIKENGVGAAHN